MNKLTLSALVVIASSSFACGALAQDAAAGKTSFNKCLPCHSIGEGAKNKVGPELNGIVGRKMGSVEGFNYSDTLKQHNAAGEVWDAEKLNKYLQNPKGYLPGIKMVFAGLPKDSDRADLEAYLGQFDETGKKK
jgi:cytochrome c